MIGVLADRIDRVLCQGIAAAIAATGYIMLFFLKSPDGALIYVAVVIVGIFLTINY